MKNKIIYDYEEFNEKINEIINKSSDNKYSIKRINNNWKTTCDLPINHYTVGNGKKNIVLFGAFHGSEIITSEFLLYVMNEIAEGNVDFNSILDEYTLDFIPIVNPEGYIITTSIIRKFIHRNMEIDELQEKCDKYRLAYKEDDIDDDKLRKQGLEADHFSIKYYQKMFENYTWEDISDKYYRIKENLKELYKEYRIPKGAIIEWSSNSKGIDLNANIKYNKNISKIKNGQIVYLPYRHSNIICSEPGPINCPFDKNYEYTDELENKFISDFLEELNNKNELVAIFNYHSAGALIDQRPSPIPKDLKALNINLKLKALNNYLFAKIYQSETYKDLNNKQITRYRILKENPELRTRNDYFRVLYPMDLLIELSPIGGNPIGPYCDLEINYKSIMQSNIKAILKSIKNISLSNKIANGIYEWMEKNIKYDTIEEFIEKGYEIIDEKYNNIEGELL